MKKKTDNVSESNKDAKKEKRIERKKNNMNGIINKRDER